MDCVPPGHALQQLSSTAIPKRLNCTFKVARRFSAESEPIHVIACQCVKHFSGVMQRRRGRDSVNLFSMNTGAQRAHLQGLLDDIKGRHAGVADYGSGRAR